MVIDEDAVSCQCLKQRPSELFLWLVSGRTSIQTVILIAEDQSTRTWVEIGCCTGVCRCCLLMTTQCGCRTARRSCAASQYRCGSESASVDTKNGNTRTSAPSSNQAHGINVTWRGGVRDLGPGQGHVPAQGHAVTEKEGNI